MNVLKPLTIATAIALCAASVSAFAANTEMRAQQSNEAGASNQYVVSQVRKVYFFKSLDLNHNGLLSRAEIPKDMRQLRLDFMRADLDHNGQLSPVEYVMYANGTAPSYVGVEHAYIFVYGPKEDQDGELATLP